jgi:predicted component of type VI protein secretion system
VRDFIVNPACVQPLLEFRMGIRFTNNTWRAPLQLIDSWLPAPSFNQAPKGTPKVVQLFARAGWLGRKTAGAPAIPSSVNSASETQTTQPCRVRVVRSAVQASNNRSDARLVISGRINDVCAELERLAALEHQAVRHRA